MKQKSKMQVFKVIEKVKSSKLSSQNFVHLLLLNRNSHFVKSVRKEARMSLLWFSWTL